MHYMRSGARETVLLRSAKGCSSPANIVDIIRNCVLLICNKKLLVTKGIATRSKKLLVAPNPTTSNKKLLIAKKTLNFSPSKCSTGDGTSLTENPVRSFSLSASPSIVSKLR